MGLTTWTAQRIADLKRLWTDGLSARECAAELGETTKNAVVAKLHRIGFSERVNGYKQPEKHSIPRKTKSKQRVVTKRLYDLMEPTVPLPQADIADQDIPDAQRKSLMELENIHCRFPVGDPTDPEFFFCGKPEADLAGNRPYCEAHTARARVNGPSGGRLSKVSGFQLRAAG